MKPLATILLSFCLSAMGQVVVPLPPIPTNHIAITNRPAHLVVVTNIVLMWEYDDAWFEVDSSTDMIHWSFETNVPIQRTNWVFKTTGAPFKFYRMKTLLNTNTQ